MSGPSHPRRTSTIFVACALALTLAVAFFVSPLASSSPDGLERVAGDKGFLDTATDHAAADSPLADYGVQGIDDAGLSTGVAGVLGVLVCFGIGVGATVLLRRVGTSDTPVPALTGARGPTD